MLVSLRRAILVSLFFLVLLGLAYPLAETGLGQALFAHQANGSLTGNGSPLVGQAWTGPRWFQGRPDADNPMATGGTNLGPRSSVLITNVRQQIAKLQREGIKPTADLVTTSGSGVDPDIAPADAYAQASAVAKVRGLPVAGPAADRHADPRRPARLPRVAVHQRAPAQPGAGRAGRPPVNALWETDPAGWNGAAQPIGKIQPRAHVMVAGTIRAAAAVTVGSSPTWRCTLADRTGEIELLFLGRARVPGLEPGRRCGVAGTALPAIAGSGRRLVIWNPRYQLEAAGADGDGQPDTDRR